MSPWGQLAPPRAERVGVAGPVPVLVLVLVLVLVQGDGHAVRAISFQDETLLLRGSEHAVRAISFQDEMLLLLSGQGMPGESFRSRTK